MNNVVEVKGLQVRELKNELETIDSLLELQLRLDESEKFGKPKFHDFSDTDMMKWFLHERQHLNEKNDRSNRTIAEYQRELILFVEQLLEHSLEIGVDVDYIIEGSLFKSLQPRHLRRYQEWLKTASPYVLSKGSYSAATLERKTTIIKAFFTFLSDKGYIKEPIHKDLKIASVRADDRPNRDMGPVEVIHLLDAFKEAGHTVMFSIVHVLTTTGIRNEEFCRLRVNDLKIDTIAGGYYLEVLGKGNKRRSIPLKDKVVQSIRDYRAARGVAWITESEVNDTLFPTSTGNSFSPSYFSQYVKREIQKVPGLPSRDIELKITPHVFRHAFAIISKVNGVELYDIMRSLGHEKIETTMIYLEKIFEKERHAIHSWKPGVLGEYL